MSYLVLARKYRPRDFSAMVGQQHVVQALANALTQQRLHHAYLFTGTRGVGKTTVSRILAKALNCTGVDGLGGITAQPCGACAACRDIDAGRFVDYVELDAASNRGVEEITQLLDQAVYKPVLGRFKVYMVDEVHMLSNHAFNAMLKTLEEPPEYLKFVFATTDPQKVPPTVLSRCLQFNLRPMAAATVQEHLASVLGDEEIEAQPGALRLLARAARGSMRDALSLADQAIAFGAGTLTEEGVRQMLGAVESSRALELLDALALGDGAGLLARVDDLRTNGLSAAGALEEMADLLQQMAVMQAIPSAAADVQDHADVPRLAASLAPDHTALLYSMCLHGRGELALAPDEYGGLVMVLLRMLAFDPRGATQVEEVGGSAPASRARAPAAGPRPAIALQLPKFAKAAVAVGAARTGARSTGRRVDAGSLDVPAASASAGASLTTPAGVPQSQAADESLVPPWLDAPEVDAAQADGSVPVALADQVSAQEPAHGNPSSSAVLDVAETMPHRLRATELGSRWAAAVDALIARGSISALPRELAWQSQCLEIIEQTGADANVPAVWRIRVEREMLRAPAHIERLQGALSNWLGARLKLVVEPGRTDDTPALRALAEREQRQREAEKIIAEDPVVQSLLSQYRTARIVPGSIQPE